MKFVENKTSQMGTFIQNYLTL